MFYDENALQERLKISGIQIKNDDLDGDVDVRRYRCFLFIHTGASFRYFASVFLFDGTRARDRGNEINNADDG